MEQNHPAVSWEEVTPGKAARWLSHGIDNNRKISDRVVAQYALDMCQGQWRSDNAQPIQFDHEMRLLDGQHRLTAVVKSGVTISLLVVRGVRTETVSVMDAGRKRTVADYLSMGGTTCANSVAALGRAAFNWEQGARGANIFRPAVPPTNTEVLTFIEKNPEVIHCQRAAHPAYSRLKTGGRCVYGLAYWLFARCDAPATAEFFAQLDSGVFNTTSSPVYRLREKLLRDRDIRNRPHQYVYLAYFIKAWNAHLEGRELRYLRIGEDEVYPEPKRR